MQAAKKGERRRPGSSPVGYYDDTIFALGGALLLESEMPPPKSEKQLENEARIARVQSRVKKKTDNVYDENAWLDLC